MKGNGVAGIIRTEAENRHLRSVAKTGIFVEGWPDDVEVMSQDGLGLFGLDQQGNAYLDGKRLYTKRRFAGVERTIASIGVAAALVGATAAAVSAYADAQTYFSSDARSACE